MNAGMTIPAVEPSELFGLLRIPAAADPNANPLVKAVVADFQTSDGRVAARDGLKAEFANGKPAEIKTKAMDLLRRVAVILTAKAPSDAAAFLSWLRQIGQKPQRRHPKGQVCLEEEFRSAMPRRRRSEKSPARSASN
jgi:hypothetical protein